MTPRAAEEKANEIRSFIKAASRSVFLGFGFDSMNLDALGPWPEWKTMSASCFNLSISAMKRAERKLIPSSNGGLVTIQWGDRSHKVGEFLHNTEALA